MLLTPFQMGRFASISPLYLSVIVGPVGKRGFDVGSGRGTFVFIHRLNTDTSDTKTGSRLYLGHQCGSEAALVAVGRGDSLHDAGDRIVHVAGPAAT